MAGSHPKLNKPVFLALDLDDPVEALSIANQFKDHVGGFKIGPRLGYKMGANWCRKISELGPLFIDNKYFDIPSTMDSAVRASFESGASFVTVHALAGREALKRLAKLESELNQIRPFRILCITLLTSWDAATYPPGVEPSSIIEHVQALTNFVQDCGLSGIVCSALEAKDLRNSFPEIYLVTPGIRLEGDSKDDQSRTMTPLEAMQSGSSALVMGRSLLRDTKKALKSLEEIYSQLKIK